MAAKVYNLLGDNGEANRIQLVVYEDGRLFISTARGAIPITLHDFKVFAGRAAGLALGTAVKEVLAALGIKEPEPEAEAPPERPPGGPDPKSN